jgi:hypothetical protein
LHDLLKPRVTKLLVCDPRRNALLQETGNTRVWQSGRLADSSA